MKKLLIILLWGVLLTSCQQDEFLTNEDKEITKESSNLPKTTLSVLNQNQVRQKFGKKSSANSLVNFNSVKTNGAYDNFVIDTEYINSIEGENFHSLTYLVTYPENPNLYVNLIFFSNDFVHYHPVIYKYNLSAAELKKDIIISEDQIFPIRIGEGQNYLDVLAGIPQTTYVDTNDPCVVTYWREVQHKCKDDAHLPGDGICKYIGTSGEAYTTYEYVIDVSGCGDGGGGGGPDGPGNGGNPGGGYVGIDDPGNPSDPGQHYQNPWLGNPGGGGGGWQPEDPVITLPNLPWDWEGRQNIRFFKKDLSSEQLAWWNNNNETPEKVEIYVYIYEGGDKEVAFRYIDLLIELEENPEFLIDIECSQIPNWRNLVMHQVPSSCKSKIIALDANNIIDGKYGIQYISDAVGVVANLDYFSITLNTLPIKPNSMLRYTPQEYLNYIRLNLHNLVNSQYSAFSPSTITGYNEAQIWNSNNPLTAVIHINIPGAGDGSVMCTNYANNSWVFTTIEVPWLPQQGYDGVHPVSGNREFGLKQNPNGTYTFYTRGVDRISTFLDDVISNSFMPDPFADPDALWNSLLDGVKNHTNNNSGQAGAKDIIKNRPNWHDVKDVLLGAKPKSILGCK